MRSKNCLQSPETGLYQDTDGGKLEKKRKEKVAALKS